jgi:VanZ family protein
MKRYLKRFGLGVLVCMLLRPFGVTPDLAFIAGILAGTVISCLNEEIQ